MHRERPTTPPLARLIPTRAQALRSTTLAETWTPDLGAELAQRFGPPRPAPGWRIPQAMPATDPVATAMRSFLAEPQRPSPPLPHPDQRAGSKVSQLAGSAAKATKGPTPLADPTPSGQRNQLILW